MEPTTATEGPERVEQLLRQAHLLRMREQWSAAEELVRQALQIAPEDLQGQEILADLLTGKGELDEAIAVYRKCLEAQPQKASLEEKIAHLVLRKQQDENERVTAELMLNSPREAAQRKRNTTIALLLSALCPGAGQFYNAQYVKGGVLLGTWLVTFLIGGQQFVKFMLSIALPRSGENADGMLAMVGLASGFIYIYSLLDASAQAGKSSSKLDV